MIDRSVAQDRCFANSAEGGRAQEIAWVFAHCFNICKVWYLLVELAFPYLLENIRSILAVCVNVLFAHEINL